MGTGRAATTDKGVGVGIDVNFFMIGTVCLIARIEEHFLLN